MLGVVLCSTFAIQGIVNKIRRHKAKELVPLNNRFDGQRTATGVDGVQFSGIGGNEHVV